MLSSISGLLLFLTPLFGYPQVHVLADEISGDEKSRTTSMVSSDERYLAETLAPILFFHSDEKYFPVNPLYPLEKNGVDEDSEVADFQNVKTILGQAKARQSAYLSMTTAEKAELATIYYRVSPGNRPETIVVDYWFYYVWNEYRARPGLFPFWFEGSHPNDLEHLHLVLNRDQVKRILSRSLENSGICPEIFASSAHEGLTPANKNRFPESDPSCKDIHVIIEKGSHAVGPDIDQDGVFTPGLDGDSGYKMVWGVRDRGKTWIRFNPEYMDDRSSSSIVFIPSHRENEEFSVNSASRYSYTYRLLPVWSLMDSFKQIDLNDNDRKELFETKVHWFKRVFGKSNGQSDRLLQPPPSNPQRRPYGVLEHSDSERGFLAGGTTLISDVGAFLGGRYGFLHGSKVIPDLILQAEGVVTIEGKGYLSTAAILSYPIDVITKVIGGTGVVTDSFDFENRQWDWFIGLEFRVGKVNISTTGRTMGSITHSALDFRLFCRF